MMFHSSLLFEEVGIHLSESTMFFVGVFSPWLSDQKVRRRLYRSRISRITFAHSGVARALSSIPITPWSTSCAMSRCNHSMPSYFSQLKFGWAIEITPPISRTMRTRLFGRWFVFWYFDRTYGISSFTFETFVQKSDSVRLWFFSLLVHVFASSIAPGVLYT